MAQHAGAAGYFAAPARFTRAPLTHFTVDMNIAAVYMAAAHAHMAAAHAHMAAAHAHMAATHAHRTRSTVYMNSKRAPQTTIAAPLAAEQLAMGSKRPNMDLKPLYPYIGRGNASLKSAEPHLGVIWGGVVLTLRSTLQLDLSISGSLALAACRAARPAASRRQ